MTDKTPTNPDNMVDELDRRIEEAIHDGLSNHTGEWFNGFIAPGLELTEQESRDLLLYLTKANRLKRNINQLIATKVKRARIDELQSLPSRKSLLEDFAYQGPEGAKRHIKEMGKYYDGWNAYQKVVNGRLATLNPSEKEIE